MKYICLGYIEPGKIEGMAVDERQAIGGTNSYAIAAHRAQPLVDFGEFL